MKHTFRYFAFAAVAVFALSCNNEKSLNEAVTPEDPQDEVPTTDPVETTDPTEEYDPSEYLLSFGARFENDPVKQPEAKETKVSVDLDAGTTAVENGDEVLVFVASDNKAVYVFDSSNNRFNLKGGETAVELSASASVFYPADEYEVDGESVKFIMPAAIEASDDFGAINPMAGVIAGSEGAYEVLLCNLASVLRVQVTADVNINSVKLDYGTGVNYASGAKFTVDASAKTMALSSGSAGTDETVALGTPATSADVLFIIPTLGLGNGLTVTANLAENHNGGANSFSVTNSATTARPRNKISTMSFYAGLFSGGAGVDGDPYLIANARDFKNLQKYTVEGYTPGSKTAASFLSAYYKQTANIDFKNASLTPIGIGAGASAFSGTYDGNGKQLQNVNINVDTQFAAPFGYVNNGTIKNLTVSGIITKTGETDNSLSGGIAGILRGTAQVTGCTNQATITSTATYTGGIAGRLYDSTASISDSHNSGTVSGVACVGGIVGNQEGGKVYACENSGNVTASQAEAGGIAGRFQGGTIKACYSANGALISGASCVGGIAGYQSNKGRGASLIINCASKSKIKSTGDGNNGAAGGLVGYMYSAAEKGDVVLTNSVALGNGVFNTNQADSYLGAIVGQVNGAAKLCYVRNCYSQHNSTTNPSAAVYYSSDGSTITSTKGANMGGIYGYLDRGTVQNCYCVGTDGANGNGININAYAGAGAKTDNGSAGNTRMVSNAVKNGTATVNASTWTIAVSSIKPTEMTTAYLVDIMNLGTWTSASKDVRSSYISSEGTEEFVCEWVGLNGTAPATYDPAYPSELKDLGTSYRP